MDVVKGCIDEIALSGLEGCTLQELWDHISHSYPSYLLDDSSKAFLWRQLCHFMRADSSSCPLLSLYRTKTDRLPTPAHLASGKTAPPFVRDGGVKGTCSWYSEKEEVTEDILEENLQLPEVIERFQDHLVIVANQEAREMVLVPTHLDMSLSSLNDQQYAILEEVGRARHVGVPRPFLTSYFKMDARSCFHYVKVMRKAGFLFIKVCRKLIDNRVNVVWVVYLSRFAPREKLHTRITNEKMVCAVLEKAPQSTLPLSVIRKSMNIENLAVLMCSLVDRGILAQILTPVHSYKLIQAYREPQEGEELGVELEDEGEGLEEEGLEEEEEEEKPRSFFWPLVSELPLEMQAYRYIESFGAEGIYAADFCSMGPDLEHCFKRQFMKNLVRSGKVVTIQFDTLRTKKLKLVAKRLLHQNTEYRSLMAEKVRAGPDMTVDLPITCGKRSMVHSKSAGSRKGGKGETLDLKADKMEPVPEFEAAEAGEDGGEGGREWSFIASGGQEEVSEQSRSVTPFFDESSQPPFQEQEDSGSFPVAAAVLQSGSGYQVMTLKRLKRLNGIMDFMEDHRLINDITDITKHIRDVELGEGIETVMDRKTMTKLLQHLVTEKRLGQTVVELKGDSVSIKDQTAFIYHLPDVDPQEIEGLRQLELDNWKKSVIRKKVKQEEASLSKGQKKQKKKKKKWSLWMLAQQEGVEEGGEGVMEEGEEGEEEREGEEEEEVQEMVTVALNKTVCKFQKLRQFHYFLWALAYGYTSQDTHMEEEVSGGGGGGCLSPQHFPWVRVVEQLPASHKGVGWLDYNQIVANVPLVLWMLLFRLYGGQERTKIPAKYVSYFMDPQKQLLKFHELPSYIRTRIIDRDILSVNYQLQLLKAMNLVETDHELHKQVNYIYIRPEVEILDTTPTPQRHSFFSNEGRGMFSSIKYHLRDMRDLQHYWFDLQSICLKTNIVMKSKNRKPKAGLGRKRKRPVADELPRHDLYPLHYTPPHTHMSASTRAGLDEGGFGAGGLPPSMFSHLSRNWCTGVDALSVENVASFEVSEGVAGGASGEGLHYGPGVGLMDIAQDPDVSDVYVVGDSGEEEEEEGEKEGEGEEGEGPSTRKIRRIMVPGSMVKPHQGGRGQMRLPRRKYVIKRQRAPLTSKTKSLPSPLLLIPDVEEEPSRGSARVEGEREGEEEGEASEEAQHVVASGRNAPRPFWRTEDDNFLIMCYLACLILHQRNQPPVSIGPISTAYHQRFPTSRPKDPSSINRRLRLLYRKKAGPISHLGVYVAECLCDLDSMGDQAPPLSFEPILEFVLSKYRNGVSTSSDDLTLTSLKELHDKFDVVGPGDEPVATEMASEHAQQVKLLADIIVAVLSCVELEGYDSYKTFKLFESFPEEDLVAAYQMLGANLVKRKKSQAPSLMRDPKAGTFYMLSRRFFARFEGSLGLDIGTEMENFDQLFQGLREDSRLEDVRDGQMSLDVQDASQSSSGDVVEVPDRLNSDPAASVVDQNCLLLDAGAALGGSVAMAAEKTISKRELISCHTLLPHPLLILDPKSRQSDNPSAMEPGEEEKEEGQVDAPFSADVTMPRDQHLFRELDNEEEGVTGPTHIGTSHPLPPGSVTSTRQLAYGSLHLQPSYNIGRLLDPLPSESCDLTHPLPGAGVSSDVCPTKRSVNSYLDLCREHLGFSPDECQAALELYQQILGAGKRGVAEAELVSGYHGNCGGGRSLEEHIECLMNFEMVYRVGFDRDLLVSHDHSGSWLLNLEPSKPEAPLVVQCKPWMSMNSCDPHVTLLEKYRHAVYSYVVTHPGVTMDDLIKNFEGLLQPCRVREILQMLECDDKVKAHTCSSNPFSLFGKNPSGSTGLITYYEPSGLQ